MHFKSTEVDILLGTNYFGLHPKKEVSSVENLSIMSGALGLCLQGTHPDLREELPLGSNCVKEKSVIPVVTRSSNSSVSKKYPIHKVSACHSAQPVIIAKS